MAGKVMYSNVLYKGNVWYLRQNFKLSKSLVLNREPCSKHLSSLSIVHESRTSNKWNKIIYLHQPQLTQARHFSFLSIQSFYDSINSSEACKLLKQVLIDVHDFTALPWSVTIMGCAIIMKLLISTPCGIFQQHLLTKLELTKIELNGKIKSIQEKLLHQARKEKWTKDKLMYMLKNEVRKEWTALVVKNNCHPFKATILFFIQFPFWLLMTLTIRSFATEVHRGTSEHLVAALQFTLGGPFWCQNLTVPDPTFILPTINCLALLANTEISMLSRNLMNTTQNKLFSIINKSIPVFLRLFAFVFFFISAASPSAVSLFWASSSVYAVAQSLLFMSPRIRRCLRIPKTPSEFDKPFSNAWSTISEKWGRIFSKMK